MKTRKGAAMRILMVEDDKKLCEAVCYRLEQEGYTVDVCNDGDDGLRWIRQQAHDLILLDRMLPTLSGTTVLERMRSDGITTPVLVVTALDTVHDRVSGLDAGADDYLTKPFAMEELLARIRAMSRRPHQWENLARIRWGDVTLDLNERFLTGAGGVCTLSRREAGLLESFLRNAGQTLPRAVLLARVWGPDAAVEEGNLDNYVYFLRRRLQSVGSRMQIKNVRGVGYLLEEPHV